MLGSKKAGFLLRIVVPLLAFWHAFAFRLANWRIKYAYAALSLSACTFYAFISHTNAFAHYTRYNTYIAQIFALIAPSFSC